ncbi:MAG: hypothetical protein WC525_04805 [Candidatus Thermoplasmatota archaeon]
MDKKPLIGISILVVVFLMLSSMSNIIGYGSSLPVARTQPSTSPAYLIYVTSAIQPTSLPHLKNLPSSHGGSGPIIWSTILPARHPAVSIGNNGTYIFTGSILDVYPGPVCFELYSTQGSGQPLWQYTANNLGYVQVDAAKERDVLVGLTANNPDQPEQPPFQRLYKWTSASSIPDWYFDIPLSYHVYQGGLVEHNFALSGDGTRVILAATNTTNNLIQIFQFDVFTGELLTSYPLYLDSQDQAYVATLDVSTDGSLVLVTYPFSACLVDLTTQTIRWTSDCPLGAISGDGSTLVSFAYNNSMAIIVLEWNATNQYYHERWRQLFLPAGWGALANGHSVDISEDGSTIIVGCCGNMSSPPALQTKTVLFDSQSGRLWENTRHGHGFDIIIDVRLSRTGVRAIVASKGDEFGSVDQLRVFDRNDSHPRFTIHGPWFLFLVSADITRDGAFATAAASTIPFRGGGGGILYSLNASGHKLTRNLTATFNGGRAFKVHIENNENETVTDILWTMYITGGIFHQVSYRAFGFIPSIDSEGTVTVTSERLIGFGRIQAYVTIESTWYPVSGWIIGRYIFLTSPRNVI